MNILKRKRESESKPSGEREEKKESGNDVDVVMTENQDAVEEIPAEVMEYNNEDDKPSEEDEPSKIESTEFTEEFIREAEEYAYAEGLDRSELDKAIENLRVLRDKNTSIDIAMLKNVVKAMNYDKDIKAAYSKGELAGRNAKIEELYMQPVKSDGLPHPKGNNPSRSRRVETIFDLARTAI